MNRSVIGLITAASLSLALVACGSDDDDGGAASSSAGGASSTSASTAVSSATSSSAGSADASSAATTGSSSDAAESPSAAAAGGPVAKSVDLKGVKITAGSKEYTEQRILGQIIVKALKAAGADVKDQTGLNGTKVARAALTSGQIDAYYEYTGTGWLTILQETKPISDAQELFTSVRDGDVKNKITWFALAPFNNTYAVGVTEAAAASTGVKTISQYAELARKEPAKAKICASAEFTTREDGLPGLEKHYDFKLPSSAVFQAESTVEFEAAKKGDCDFLRLDSTDARILANKIVALEDDKNFFPVYNPAITMRTEVYEAHKAQYDTLFEAISKLLTQEAILGLNVAVELDGLPADKVAEDWLKKNGII